MNTNAPKRFNGYVKLYSLKYDRTYIKQIKSKEIYASFECLHGMQELEGIEKYQNSLNYNEFYEDMWKVCETHINRLKQLQRLERENWDWDWYYMESEDK